jgi:23S rRNA A2030 N6-methylase RlmJ
MKDVNTTMQKLDSLKSPEGAINNIKPQDSTSKGDLHSQANNMMKNRFNNERQSTTEQKKI